MTCEEDKLISEVLGEDPRAENCPEPEPEELDAATSESWDRPPAAFED